MFPIKDQNGHDTQKLRDSLNKKIAMKNMRKSVTLKVLRKTHFYSLITKIVGYAIEIVEYIFFFASPRLTEEQIVDYIVVQSTVCESKKLRQTQIVNYELKIVDYLEAILNSKKIEAQSSVLYQHIIDYLDAKWEISDFKS